MTIDTDQNQVWRTTTRLRLPFGPHTCLFNRAKAAAERKRLFDAELAKLTPANIAAMERVTSWLFEGGYPQGMAT